MALFTVTNSPGQPKSFNSWITDIDESHDGDLYVYGNFTEYDNTSAGGIIKISKTGVIQTDFDYGTGFGGVYAFEYTGLILDPVTNAIIVSGNFTSYNGTGANRVVKIDPDGSIDTAFVYGTGFNNWALSGNIYNGSVYIPGIYSSYNGGGAARLNKINAATGVVDSTFATNVGAAFDNTTIQAVPDGLGNLYVHGYFTGSMKKLNATTGLDAGGFNIGTGPNIAGVNKPMDLSFDSAGKLLMSGYFTQWNGVSHGYMVKLNTDGTIYTSFDIGTGFNNVVYYASFNSSDEILCLGAFTSFNGTSLSFPAVILNANGTLKEVINVPSGFGFETPARIGDVWYVSANNYTTGRYYIAKIDDNGNREFIT